MNDNSEMFKRMAQLMRNALRMRRAEDAAREAFKLSWRWLIA
jgi:hypothetical protein